MQDRTRMAVTLGALLLAAAAVVTAGVRREEPAAAQSALAITPDQQQVTVYRTPGCGCCLQWVEHLEKANYQVTVRDTAIASYDAALGVPQGLNSCHTTRIGGYVIVGHVPIDAVQRLLREKPSDVAGIAVAGMPIGSTGMEVPGRPAQSYEIMAWDRQGRTRVFEKR